MKQTIQKVLTDKILTYTADRKISLGTFAKRADVPLDAIQAIIKDDFNITPFHHAYSILKIVDPTNLKAVLAQHFAIFFSPNLSDPLIEWDVSKHAAAALMVVKNKLLYKLYCMVSTEVGTSREEILARFGWKGAQALDLLLQQEVFVETEDGRIKDPYYDKMLMNDAVVRRMMDYNLQDFEPDDPFSLMFTSIEGFNEEGLHKVKNLMKAFHSDLSKIISDPRNLGKERFFVNAACGKVFPKEYAFLEQSSDVNQPDMSSAEMLAGLAHDMRVPMKYVLNFLRDEPKANYSKSERARARNAALRVDLMIDALKRMEGHGLVSRQVDRFSLESILDFAETMSDGFNKKFSYDGPKDFQGYIDSEKVDRLLQNLIMNAFEAAHSEVRLECLRENDQAKFVVVDDGPGVPSEAEEKIFERGFSFNKKEGTGLGLASVKAIAEGHEGRVWYERIGTRTLFTVVLSNVFMDSKFEGSLDPILRSLQPSIEKSSTDKPILFFRIANATLQADVMHALQKSLPAYRISDDLLDLTEAWLVCSDSIDYVTEATEAGVHRVWAVSGRMVEHAAFLSSLINLANRELPNYSQQPSEVMA